MAVEIDRFLHDDPHLLPVYKTLCVLRNMEAVSYLERKEVFTAFVLGWLSIEMSVYRLWYRYISKTYESIKHRKKLQSFMKWDVERVMEILFMSDPDPEYVKIKPQLDCMRGIRNNLLHGELASPTEGHTKTCILTAQSMSMII